MKKLCLLMVFAYCTFEAQTKPAEPSTPRSVLEAYISAWNRHDSTAFDKILAADAIHEDVAEGVRARGVTEMKGWLHTCLQDEPDFTWQITNVFESGSYVAAEWTWTSTHTGNSPIGPVVGMPISQRGATIAVIENGRIKRMADYFDDASAYRKPAPQSVPAYQELRHHMVFQNSLVRVLDVRIPAGDTTAFHVHSNPLIGIAVKDARSWSQMPGEPTGSIKEASPAPYVLNNWDRTLPYTHRVANADTIPIHYLIAEWLASPGIAGELLPEDGMRHLVKEGRFARVYCVTIPAHAATAMHNHAVPGLTVLGSDGVLVDEGDQPAAVGGSGVGHWSWRNAGHSHVLRNAGDKALTVYEIDWR